MYMCVCVFLTHHQLPFESLPMFYTLALRYINNVEHNWSGQSFKYRSRQFLPVYLEQKRVLGGDSLSPSLPLSPFFSPVSWLLSSKCQHPWWRAGHWPTDALEENIPVWHNPSFHAIYTKISKPRLGFHWHHSTACNVQWPFFLEPFSSQSNQMVISCFVICAKCCHNVGLVFFSILSPNMLISCTEL